MSSSHQSPSLSLWAAIALVVGNMIGSGIFLLPASLAAYGGVSLLGWLVSSAGALILALVFSRLSRMLPRAGGPYAYTREGFGELPAFLVAWGYWISIWAGNAAIAVAMTGYLTVFWPVLAEPLPAYGLTMAAVWGLSLVNYYGMRTAGYLQLLTTILKLLPLLLLAAAGLMYFQADHFLPFNASGQSLSAATGATATLTLWAFLGLESATIPAAAVRNPARNIPRATLWGTALVAMVYILSTVAVMSLVPAGELMQSEAPFAAAAARLWGDWGEYLVAAGAAISCFGALNGWILLQGQLPLAVAQEKLFPSIFARLSPRATPWVGIVVSSLCISILLLFNYARSLVEVFTFVILLSTMTVLLPYVFCALAEVMIRFRRKQPVSPRLLILTVLAFGYSVWAIAGAGTEVVYWGFLLLLTGLPVFVWVKRDQN